MVASVLLQFSQLYLLAFFFYGLRLCLLDWLAVIELVFLLICVDVVRTLRLGFAVVVHLQVAALYLFAVHFNEGCFCAFVGIELDVGESFRLLCLPVVRNPNRFDFSETTEPVTNVIFLEVIGEPFNEECFTIRWHKARHFY